MTASGPVGKGAAGKALQPEPRALDIDIITVDCDSISPRKQPALVRE